MAEKSKGGSERGFASMDPKKQHEIASEGGKASGGNFKNDPERASEAGKKGGEHSHGGTHEQHVKAGQQSHKNS
jgi:general stress protein YciG